MVYKKPVVWVTVVLFLALGGCGGGGGGDGSSGGGVTATALSGTWVGSYHSAVYSSNAKLTVSVDGSNHITSIYHDNLNLNYTGTITHKQNLLYEFTLSDGYSEGGFLVDASTSHAGFLNSYNGDFGVLQRNATGLASGYALADLQGNWSGYSVQVDSSGNVISYGTSSATVDSTGNVTHGTGPFGAFTANFDTITGSSVYGVFAGTYNNTTNSTIGNMRLYLSPDKTFAASWSCDGAYNPPSTSCSYNSWKKQ